MRWTLFRVKDSKWGGIFLHRFLGDDPYPDLHDHPMRSISLGVKGSYVETTVEGQRVWKAPWVRFLPADRLHRISLTHDVNGVPKPCWTIFIVLKFYRESGCLVDGKWQSHRLLKEKSKNHV